MPPTTGRPSASIIAAAVALLLASSGIVIWSVWYLRAIYRHAGSIQQVLLYAHSPSAAAFDFLTIPQIAFGLLGIIASIGLLRLRERARKLAVFLSIAPIIGVVFALLFFLSESQVPHGAESLNAGLGFMLYAGFLVIFLPLSIWWLALLTREKVRSQFN